MSQLSAISLPPRSLRIESNPSTAGEDLLSFESALPKIRQLVGNAGNGLARRVLDAAGEALGGTRNDRSLRGNALSASTVVREILVEWRDKRLSIHQRSLNFPQPPSFQWKAVGESVVALRSLVYLWSSRHSTLEERDQSIHNFVEALQSCFTRAATPLPVTPLTLVDGGFPSTPLNCDSSTYSPTFKVAQGFLNALPPAFVNTPVAAWPQQGTQKGFELATVAADGKPVGAATVLEFERLRRSDATQGSPDGKSYTAPGESYIALDKLWLAKTDLEGGKAVLEALIKHLSLQPNTKTLLISVPNSPSSDGQRQLLESMGAKWLQAPFSGFTVADLRASQPCALAVLPLHHDGGKAIASETFHNLLIESMRQTALDGSMLGSDVYARMLTLKKSLGDAIPVGPFAASAVASPDPANAVEARAPAHAADVSETKPVQNRRFAWLAGILTSLSGLMAQK